MTRITESQILRNSLNLIQNSRNKVTKFSDQVSSGIKVGRPGDDAGSAPTIATIQEALNRFAKHSTRISSATATLGLQEDVLAQAGDLMIRAREIATQGANEVIGSDLRQRLSYEVFQLRDAMVDLANTKYQGQYIYSGAANNQPAFSLTGPPGYTDSNSVASSQRYAYNNNPGSDIVNTVQITDDTAVTINTPGDQVFSNAIHSLERLGRALEGFRTTTVGGVPDGSGTAYTFPADFSEQTQDILSAMTDLDLARTNDISREQASVGGKLARADNALSLLDSLRTNLGEVLTKTQGADIFESATSLSEAQTALQASLSASSAVLKISLLDYL